MRLKSASVIVPLSRANAARRRLRTSALLTAMSARRSVSGQLPPPRRVKVGLCGFTIAIADYPRSFPVVEVQQTFYQPSADAVLRRWRDSVPEGFEFTIKAWQLVTHAANSPTY